MTKVLVLNASTTGTTKQLWDLTAKEFHPDWDVTTVDLNTELTTPLTGATIGQFYNDGTKYIDMMQQFDKVVLLGSMVNYAVNSTMKTFIDKITLPKVTFGYTAEGQLYSPMQGKWNPEFTVYFTSGTAKQYYPANIQKTVETFMDVLKFNGMEKTQYIWLDGTNMPDVASLSIEGKYEAMKPKLKNIVKY